MSFFEPPPSPPAPDKDEFRTPGWFGPPDNVLGAAVPLRLVLARTTDVAIAVVDATAYPSGIEFTLALRLRSLDEDLNVMQDPLGRMQLGWQRRVRPETTSDIPPEVLRFGIQFSDGAKATTLSQFEHFGDPEQQPSGPVLTQRGGGGGGRTWNFGFWLWPLPPPGPLAFVCEWPARGIALTRVEVDTGDILAAAEQAETLWPEGGASSGGGVTSQLRLG